MLQQTTIKKTRLNLKLGALVSVFLALASTTQAQPSTEKTASDGIAAYRALIAQDNPAELFEEKGKLLWTTTRGPKNATLQKCDLGKGAGIVKGAFVELPRYFADVGLVQDLEARLLTCMETLQGISAAETAKTAFGQGEQKNIEAYVAWIAAESKGLKFNLSQSHAQEKKMYELGKRMFFYRGGTHDFACASCHSAEGQRIRLQDLPNLTKNPEAAKGFGAWPAYRVSSGELWGMQRRINDCFRQQRFPFPNYGSEATVALSVYMGVNAKDGVSTAPTIKR
jgi:L-cysteine S-thiosulfotransferase